MKLAFDKKSVRTVDSFGRMRVEISNISKAAVNPYYGSEIPNGAALGLDDKRVYKLLRDPEELRKAADTFNNLPVLSKHVPVTAAKPEQSLVVGSTGTDAVFDEPYLRNSLVIWEAVAIAGVNTSQVRGLSSAYAYDADMTPGVYAGLQYDGVMRNIRGNHVALVEEGRAGPDVVVGDSKLLEIPKMKLSMKAQLLMAALAGYMPSVIAQDAQIEDNALRIAVGSAKTLKTEKERKAVAAAVTKVMTPHLAQDMGLEGLAPLIAAIADSDDPTPEMPGAMDGDPAEQIAALLGQLGMSPEVIAQVQALCGGGAMDEFPPKDDKEKDDPVDKTAMDAAIKAATDQTRAQMQAVRAAEIEVAPLIGALTIAQDSAADVYKLALDHAKVDLTGVDPSAYKAMVGMLKAQRAAPATVVTPARLALDSAVGGAASFAKRFPNASKVGA